MILNIKKLDISSGGINIVILNDIDAFNLNVKPGSRIRIYKIDSKEKIIEPGIIGIVDLAKGNKIIQTGFIGCYDEIFSKLNLDSKDNSVEITLSSRPKSYTYIRKKIKGIELNTQEILEIIDDCIHERLLQIELASLITGIEIHGLTDDEIVHFTYGFTRSGDVLDLGPDCMDKHSTGGVPGNKITLIIVPILSAAGLLIPKTSTRAITSPSGTGDSMEVLAPVSFSKEKLLIILKEQKAGIFWAGAINSAPAADIFLTIEKSLNIDPLPLMIASILSKKLSMGVKKLVLDIPVGTKKFPTIDDGRKFALRFKEIAKRVGIQCICALTSASQPIGHKIGPALEAQEALELLQNPQNGPSSLLNKSTDLAGYLLEMAGKAAEGHGKEYANRLIQSGKAYQSMQKIIALQGGNSNIQPNEIIIGPYKKTIKSEAFGIISKINNEHINTISKIAGCPSSKSAGIDLHYKIGHKIKIDDDILTIYSSTEEQLKKAVEYYNSHPVISLASMTIEKL